MRWFRRHLLLATRLTLAAWVVAFGITALSGCLVDDDFASSSTGVTLSSTAHADGHSHTADACQQQCANLSSTASRSINLTQADLFALVLPLAALPLLVFVYAGAPGAMLPVFLPSPRRPLPARLRFVRLNT